MHWHCNQCDKDGSVDPDDLRISTLLAALAKDHRTLSFDCHMGYGTQQIRVLSPA